MFIISPIILFLMIFLACNNNDKPYVFYNDIQGVWMVESTYDFAQFNENEFLISSFGEDKYKGVIEPIDDNSIKLIYNDTISIIEKYNESTNKDSLWIIGYPFSEEKIELLTKLY